MQTTRGLLACPDDVLGSVLGFAGTGGVCARVTCRRLASVQAVGGKGVAFLYLRRCAALWPGAPAGLPPHPAPMRVRRLVLLELPLCDVVATCCDEGGRRWNGNQEPCCACVVGADRFGPDHHLPFHRAFKNECTAPGRLPLARSGGVQLFGEDDADDVRSGLWALIGRHVPALAARYPDVEWVLHSHRPARAFGAAVCGAWPGAAVVLGHDEHRRFHGSMAGFPGYRKREVFCGYAFAADPDSRPRRLIVSCDGTLTAVEEAALRGLPYDCAVEFHKFNGPNLSARLIRLAATILVEDKCDGTNCWDECVRAEAEWPAADGPLAVTLCVDRDRAPLRLPSAPLRRVVELRLRGAVPPADAAEFARAFPNVRRIAFHGGWEHRYVPGSVSSGNDSVPAEEAAPFAAVLRLPQVREYAIWDEDDVPYADYLPPSVLRCVGEDRVAAGSLPLFVDRRMYRLCSARKAILPGPGLAVRDVEWDTRFGDGGDFVP